jgi:hypothetical protein
MRSRLFNCVRFGLGAAIVSSVVAVPIGVVVVAIAILFGTRSISLFDGALFAGCSGAIIGLLVSLPYAILKRDVLSSLKAEMERPSISISPPTSNSPHAKSKPSERADYEMLRTSLKSLMF